MQDTDAEAQTGTTRARARLGLAALLLANLVSVAGGALSVIALPWFVLETTGSAAATGLAVVCETAPLVVVVAAAAGAVVDRFGAMATRVGSDVISAATVLAIPLLHATTGIAYWQLLVLMALNGAVRAPAPAASLVLLNALVPVAGMSGDRARSLYSAGIRLAFILGTPVGGAVIAWRGAPTALVLDAASFAVSALLLLAVLGRGRARPDADVADAAPRSRWWAGLSMLAADRTLAPMSVLLVGTAVLFGGWTGVLAPSYGLSVLGDPRALGGLLAVFSAGALLGTLAYPWVAARVGAHRLVVVGVAVETALLYGVLAAVLAVSVLLVAMAVAGLAMGTISPLWLGLVTTRSSPHQQGHVFGASFALEQAGGAAGAGVAGVVVSLVGISGALTASAAVGVVLTAVAVAAPGLRDLRRGG